MTVSFFLNLVQVQQLRPALHVISCRLRNILQHFSIAVYTTRSVCLIDRYFSKTITNWFAGLLHLFQQTCRHYIQHVTQDKGWFCK